MNAVEELDRLIDELETALARQEGGGDAIDRVLAAAPRETAVRGLRGDESMARFRQELINGLIRVDTAGRVLDLVRRVLVVVLAGRA